MINQTLENGLLEKLPASPKDKVGWSWTKQTDPNIYKNLTHIPKISIVTPSFNQGQYIDL